jgi:hypothetical protein
MKLVNSLALALFLGSAAAFGPASPVLPSAFGVTSSKTTRGDMTMRIGKEDMIKRRTLKSTLEIVGANPSKEMVERFLLSPKTGELLQVCNWKLRQSVLRKIRNQAWKFDVVVDAKFGQR